MNEEEAGALIHAVQSIAASVEGLAATIAETFPSSNVVHVEILKADDGEDFQGQWYFVAKAGNGEIVVTSELYDSKANAKRGATDVFPSARQTVEAG